MNVGLGIKSLYSLEFLAWSKFTIRTHQIVTNSECNSYNGSSWRPWISKLF